ncbi:DUF5686 and carboxypeptidase-like regulatory domain-containing protein [Runella rosea]|uniref:DUF5686 and carboxypeptidase-like regulatory domain-containing protein n=1 Tax=Runella rosea TaxID=2259595 RepID=UPI001E327BDE|nr:DUF5686 and carboxypeptidase-like regulatory domain-containing protein [Runella rosea]
MIRRLRFFPIHCTLVCFVLFWSLKGVSQTTYTISGRITDAQTGDPIPFAGVAIKGKTAGVTTNFEGFYTLKTTQIGDSLMVSSMSYRPKTKAIRKDSISQVINFQLESSEIKLQEVKVYAGENPAYNILRKVIKQKPAHNPNRLTAYEYESYNKIEVDVDNLSQRFKKRKAIRKITEAVDKFEKIAGEDGRPVIPIYLSESISNYYFREIPRKKKEQILKTKISGIAVTDGSLISQLIGSSFQQYNFYQNWLSVVEKDFHSPIADGWKSTYEYYLIDTTFVGGYWCYQIDYEPKRAQDLAFNGTIWIDTLSHALVQVDASVGKRANINFIERIKIQQEYEQIGDSTWMPIKSRMLIDVAELTDSTAGMLVKFYTSNRNVTVNKPRPPKFYDYPLELSEDYKEYPEDYWDKVRHEPLTAGEKTAYQLIDSVKQVPVVRTYVEVLNMAVNGYKRIPKVNIDVGPFLYLYSNNVVEGNRIRIGGKTNPDFSRKWILSGHAAYGTLDQKWKYNFSVDYIFSRKPWTIGGISHSYDLERIGLSSEAIGNNALFGAMTRWGSYRRGYFEGVSSAYVKRELFRGLTQTVGLRHRSFEPMYAFAYRTTPGMGDRSPTQSNYQNSELFFETRWGKDEVFIYNENERLTLGTQRWPLVVFRYQMGLRNLMNSDFSYHRLSLNVKQSFRVGIWGRSNYNVTLGYIPSTLPYPMLYTPLGNESLFYVENAFNLMNYFEFVSDKYVQLRYEHNFEGLLFNRIPAIKRLKWRFLANAKVLYGSVRPANMNLLAPTDAQGRPVLGFSTLGKEPYVEVGYAIDNIFKVLRVDAIHRLTYRQNPGITPFAVKFSFWFNI